MANLTVDEGQRLAAIISFFIYNGYHLPSGIRSVNGSFRYTDYSSNSEQLYAQEQQTSKMLRAYISRPSFSVNYGSDSQVLEVELSSNQVYKIVDKANYKEYFPVVSGSLVTIDGTVYYKT